MAKKSASQVTKPAGDAAAVARRIEVIEELFQVRGSFERFPVPVDKSMEGHFSVPVANAYLSGENRITAIVHMEFEWTVSGEAEEGERRPDSDPDRRLAMNVEASYVVRYRMSEGPAPSEEDLQAFAIANGAFNVNPYWREYLSNSITRSGLPPIIAPVMKVSQSDAKPVTGSEAD